MGGCSRGVGEKGVCQFVNEGGRVRCFTPVDEQRLVVNSRVSIR